MQQLNHVHLIGTVGAVRINTVSDTKIAHLSVVTNYIYKDKNGDAVIECTWHTVTAFEGRDISLDGLEKGAKVDLEGRLRSQRYTTSTGEERTSMEVLANKLIVISKDTEWKYED